MAPAAWVKSGKALLTLVACRLSFQTRRHEEISPHFAQASLPDRHAAHGRSELRANRHLPGRAQRAGGDGPGDQQAQRPQSG